MPTPYLTAADAPAAAALLRAHPDYRLLERLPRPYGDLPDTLPDGGRMIAIVDVETEGLDPDQDKIIELALMYVALDADGEVVGHSQPQSWREDPGRPLSADVTALTGIADADLAGQSLDEKAIMAVLKRCDLIVAHNASFDIRFVDRRLPGTDNMPWACSCAEISWTDFGMPCRRLGHLLMEHGAFFTGHRAEADVWATFQLLQRRIDPRAGMEIAAPPHTTYFQLLLASSDAGAVRLRAVGLPFDRKDWAKGRGYRWDPVRRVWWRDVPMTDYMAEKAVFAELGLPEPQGTRLDATNRYRV